MRNFWFLVSFLFVLFSPAQVNTKLGQKAMEAEKFCSSKGYNTGFCFLIDMSIHSGRNRFFVYDLKGKKVIHEGLVCHGMGRGSTESRPEYSNAVGSYCTSLGKYKIGARSYSRWGINVHYKMLGLEKTNSNAFARAVVLHSYDHVPEKEIYPSYLTMGMSLGCPVVSNSLMKKIDGLLKKTTKPTLLWIYE